MAPTGGISNRQSSKGMAGLLPRLLILFVAFAVIHLPLGASEPLRPLQYHSTWPKEKIRAADLPLRYSVQEQGRVNLAAATGIRFTPKTKAADAPPNALPPSGISIPSNRRTAASGPTDTSRDLEIRTAAFSARAPPSLT